MTDHDQSRHGGTAGGSLLAFATIAGAVIGTANGEPTIGLLAGFGIGVLLFVAVWLIGRRRL